MAPTIRVSAAAASALQAAVPDEGEVLHLEVSPRYEYDLFFGPRGPSDVEVLTEAGVRFYLDASSASRLRELEVDYVTGPAGEGFRLRNPHEPAKVQSRSPQQVRAMLDAGELVEVWDVRTDAERAIASVAAAKALTPQSEAALLALDRATPVAFLCHHGVRSRAAAERYAAAGFRTVYNIEGGIDAWSVTVDPTVRRY